MKLKNKGLLTLTALIYCLCAPLALAASDDGTTPTALSCSDFVPTEEALARYPDLLGACEAVVERQGELYGKFRAVVRRASSRSVTMYLPATDHTFTIKPDSGARVLIGNSKVRARDLQRGQEIRIYLSTSTFATPDIQEVALVTESEVMIPHEAVTTAALPTTASQLPNIALASLALLFLGGLLRRRRINHS